MWGNHRGNAFELVSICHGACRCQHAEGGCRMTGLIAHSIDLQLMSVNPACNAVLQTCCAYSVT